MTPPAPPKAAHWSFCPGSAVSAFDQRRREPLRRSRFRLVEGEPADRGSRIFRQTVISLPIWPDNQGGNGCFRFIATRLTTTMEGKWTPTNSRRLESERKTGRPAPFAARALDLESPSPGWSSRSPAAPPNGQRRLMAPRGLLPTSLRGEPSGADHRFAGAVRLPRFGSIDPRRWTAGPVRQTGPDERAQPFPVDLWGPKGLLQPSETNVQVEGRSEPDCGDRYVTLFAGSTS